MTTTTTTITTTTTRILQLNAVCLLGMGAAFIASPTGMIPPYMDCSAAGTIAATTTTRVFGTALLALSLVTWCGYSSSNESVTMLIAANLIFQVGGGVFLLKDAFVDRPDQSPFLPPSILHVMLSVLLLYACWVEQQGVRNNKKSSSGKKER